MACRKTVTERQMRAAQMLIDGKSAYRALIAAGYSRWTARAFGKLMRGSWGLRQAILEEQERRRECMIPRPARRRRDKYSRRAVAQSVQMFCTADVQASSTNAGTRYYEEQASKARAIAEGRPMRPTRCSVCRGPLEGKDRWCPNCLRIESR